MTRTTSIACSLAILMGANVASAEDRDVDIQIIKKNDGSPVTKVIIVTADGKKREIRVGDGKLDGKSIKGLPKGVRIHVEKSVDERSTKNGDGKPKVTRRVSGRAVIVGPNGKKIREIKFGDKGVPPEALKGLPKDIRIRIERAIKGNGGGGGKTIRKQRAIIIGSDGKPMELKGLDKLPKEIRERIQKLHGKHPHKVGTHSHGIFIGPDGNKFQFQVGGPKGANLDAMLKNLPKDVREKVRAALANRWKPANRFEAKSGAGDKLDLILKRLDKLQKQVDALQKRVDRK